MNHSRPKNAKETTLKMQATGESVSVRWRRSRDGVLQLMVLLLKLQKREWQRKKEKRVLGSEKKMSLCTKEMRCSVEGNQKRRSSE